MWQVHMHLYSATISYYQSCPTHLEAGLEFLQVPDGDHHLVQTLLDLGEGGMGGWIFGKVEA